MSFIKQLTVIWLCKIKQNTKQTSNKTKIIQNPLRWCFMCIAWGGAKRRVTSVDGILTGLRYGEIELPKPISTCASISGEKLSKKKKTIVNNNYVIEKGSI